LRISNKKRIVLASASPRRKYLLKLLLSNFGLKLITIPANIAEHFPGSIKNLPIFIRDLALEKAREIAKGSHGLIIGADTVVVLGRKILNKPSSATEAKEMLKMLSGKTHVVLTGLAMIDTDSNAIYKTYERTTVSFREISEKEIDFYVRTGSPLDKAGAYGIQDDFGSTFVRRIEGDYFNVVGLPIVKTYIGLKKMLNIEF